VESGGTLPASVTSFLGPDASKLAPGSKGDAALAWVNPNAQWSSYAKILLDPVQFWAAADSKISTFDQQVLTEYFDNSLKTNILRQGFTLVDQTGPGVIRLQVALMDATTAVPGLPHGLRGRSAGTGAVSAGVHTVSRLIEMCHEMSPIAIEQIGSPGDGQTPDVPANRSARTAAPPRVSACSRMSITTAVASISMNESRPQFC
jgi:hypothetical protein